MVFIDGLFIFVSFHFQTIHYSYLFGKQPELFTNELTFIFRTLSAAYLSPNPAYFALIRSFPQGSRDEAFQYKIE